MIKSLAVSSAIPELQFFNRNGFQAPLISN